MTSKMLDARTRKAEGEGCSTSLETYFKKLPCQFQSESPIMQFQKEGICFGVSRFGRCLLADDMGLGKTLQALTIIAQYQSEWPALIVTPATMRLVWREQELESKQSFVRYLSVPYTPHPPTDGWLPPSLRNTMHGMCRCAYLKMYFFANLP